MPKTDISVRELVDKVQRGELTLPEMQRRYVWPATRVRDLLDSLYRGYPSGTILVWETDEVMPTLKMSRIKKRPSAIFKKKCASALSLWRAAHSKMIQFGLRFQMFSKKPTAKF